MKSLRFACFAVLLIISALNVQGATYYVSYSAGSDTYNGTALNTPFKTITKAISTALAGDIIYLRGEQHLYATRINISKSGTAIARISLLAYPGDATRPVLNFSAMAINSSNRGLDLSGNYWTFKGFDIYKAGDNGMHVSGSDNIFEFCAFYENADTGLQFDNGASYNQIINCDSYYNTDLAEGNADGFAVKLDVGTGNSFKGCRAWQNSDDAWDGLLTTGLGTNPSTTYDSCWAFLNGYRKNMTASLGNGNGFKMGGNQELHDARLTRCLAVYNRVKGFDQNNNKGSMVLYNCTGFKNNANFGMNNYDPAAGKVMEIRNCISYQGLSNDVFRAVAVRSNNSWQSPFVTNAADFVTIDTSSLRAPRNADGSLPAITLLTLANGSDLIDGGMNVGLPFYGTAPDLGYAESNYALPVSLFAFKGVAQNGKVMLTWTTASEQNNHGWEIERYVAGSIAWQTLGFVAGKGTTNVQNNYSYYDAAPVLNQVMQYRLKQIDIDGRFKYSPILVIKANQSSSGGLNIYPNPVKTASTVRFSLPLKAEARLSLYDGSGKKLKTFIQATMDKGDHFYQLNLEAQPAGNYIVELIADGTIYSTRIIKISQD